MLSQSTKLVNVSHKAHVGVLVYTLLLNIILSMPNAFTFQVLIVWYNFYSFMITVLFLFNPFIFFLFLLPLAVLKRCACVLSCQLNPLMCPWICTLFSIQPRWVRVWEPITLLSLMFWEMTDYHLLQIPALSRSHEYWGMYCMLPTTACVIKILCFF